MQIIVNIKKKINKALSKSSLKPYEVSWLAYDLINLFALEHPNLEDKEKSILEFKSKISCSGHNCISNLMIEYAVRLMNSNLLEFEEFNKLYSLFDEIECLQLLGDIPQDTLNKEYTLLRENFLKINKKKVKGISINRYEPWKKEWSWYQL